MIKGSLLVSLPIIKRPKARAFCSVFRTPWKKTWTDMSETYGYLIPSQALRPAIFGAKRRSAVLAEIRLIKKEIRNTCKIEQPSGWHTPARAAVKTSVVKH